MDKKTITIAGRRSKGSQRNAKVLASRERTTPNVPWIISKAEKNVVKKVIETIRTPTGTMHSLTGAFTSGTKKELSGFKTHDWHKMLQVYTSLL